MSSERLSFNQSADGEDDGARWEAYQALLRRTAVPAPEEAPLELENPLPETAESPAEPSFDRPLSLRDALETGLAAEDDPAVGPTHPAAFELEPPIAAAAIGDDSADADLGLGSWDRPRPAPPIRVRRGRGLRLVGAVMALTAGIILAASVLQPQPSRRDTPPPAAAAQVHPTATASVPAPAQPTKPLPAPHAAPVSPPARIVAASGAAKVGRLASATRDCRHCRPDQTAPKHPQPPQCWVSSPTPGGEPLLTDCPQVASQPETAAAAPRWVTPWAE